MINRVKEIIKDCIIDEANEISIMGAGYSCFDKGDPCSLHYYVYEQLKKNKVLKNYFKDNFNEETFVNFVEENKEEILDELSKYFDVYLWLETDGYIICNSLEYVIEDLDACEEDFECYY